MTLRLAQGKSPRHLKYFGLEYILQVKGTGHIDSQKDSDYDI